MPEPVHVVTGAFGYSGSLGKVLPVGLLGSTESRLTGETARLVASRVVFRRV